MFCENCRRGLPSPDGTTANPRLAQMTARMRARELNSVSEYLYQSLIFADSLPELSEFFEEIANEEMLHHRALGELILRLGGDPAERAAVRNSGGIDLCEDKPSHAPVAASRCLGSNITAEERDLADYTELAEAAERAGQLSAAAIFRAMAGEEQIHAARQRELLK